MEHSQTVLAVSNGVANVPNSKPKGITQSETKVSDKKPEKKKIKKCSANAQYCAIFLTALGVKSAIITEATGISRFLIKRLSAAKLKLNVKDITSKILEIYELLGLTKPNLNDFNVVRKISASKLGI
jgi:hypothetical protein